MRIGYNPNKNKIQDESVFLHQVIIPVYIPSHSGYFKDSFAILKLCLESLFNTVHKKTFITIVNNGSDKVVSDYLDLLFKENKIQELIHTENIGKLNAILKGLAGNNIQLVTISDSDVFFLPNWQLETVKVFREVPKAGVVGIVPQFKTYESNCGNVLFDTLFTSKLQFLPVKNKEALIRFYDSIGWDRNYNQDYLEYNLGLKINEELNVLIGSGHFVATYKKDVFENITTYIGYKMGGDSVGYLDRLPLQKDYWRLNTYDNYAYHMGNTLEDWMYNERNHKKENSIVSYNFTKRKQINSIAYFIKNRLFVKFISVKFTVKFFLKWKKLPDTMIAKY
ncbi:glycosyltransferase family A protein [Flavobacterium hibisci]|uniref:glycosyltransferase family A protein n=1 Tax=Flavobacterium hibisci TaxID=1914462 RepID=UPI001CBF9023|nr:glycosyltransferase family A protein [Flavobacterium hibisci]MBZ4041948.1 glycosyltransferase family 2 protein [Flavobacterium hibisci]